MLLESLKLVILKLNPMMFACCSMCLSYITIANYLSLSLSTIFLFSNMVSFSLLDQFVVIEIDGNNSNFNVFCCVGNFSRSPTYYPSCNWFKFANLLVFIARIQLM
jgi:hypothetical protein